MKKKTIKSANETIHQCGGGFKGQIIKSHGVKFCGFCGKEFKV